MDEQRMREIRERLETITAPPWYVVVMGERMVVERSDDLGSYFVECEVDEDWNVADAQFIARAPTDMRFLLDALAAREAEVARLIAIETAARAIEWKADIRLDGLWCPDCENERSQGHTAACAFGAALAAPPPGDGAGGGED
jgi:hypothetical protein